MDLSELLKRQQKEINLRLSGKKKDGIKTYLYDFDNIFYGGLRRGSLNVIAGRFAMGKSSLALTIACNIAEIHNLPICFFTLDDCKENLTRSFITHKTGFHNGELNNKKFNPNEKIMLDKSIEFLGKLPISIFDNPLFSTSEIYQICGDIKKEAKDKKLGLVVIEDLQSLEYFKINNYEEEDNYEEENNYEEETKINIAKKLKSLAVELDVPVIITSQVSNHCESRDNKRPHLCELKDFPEIIKYADTIILLYRDDYYYLDSEENGIAELLVLQNRIGPIGTFKLSFEPEYKKFKNLK